MSSITLPIASTSHIGKIFVKLIRTFRLRVILGLQRRVFAPPRGIKINFGDVLPKHNASKVIMISRYLNNVS